MKPYHKLHEELLKSYFDSQQILTNLQESCDHNQATYTEYIDDDWTNTKTIVQITRCPICGYSSRITKDAP